MLSAVGCAVVRGRPLSVTRSSCAVFAGSPFRQVTTMGTNLQEQSWHWSMAGLLTCSPWSETLLRVVVENLGSSTSESRLTSQSLMWEFWGLVFSVGARGLFHVPVSLSPCGMGGWQHGRFLHVSHFASLHAVLIILPSVLSWDVVFWVHIWIVVLLACHHTEGQWLLGAIAKPPNLDLNHLKTWIFNFAFGAYRSLEWPFFFFLPLWKRIRDQGVISKVWLREPKAEQKQCWVI